MNSTVEYEVRQERREQRLDVRGIDYCINEWGAADAPTLFYLHGWADTGSTFQFVADALQNDWRVIAPDWRGFGRTRHQADCYWFPDYLADLDVILDTYSPSQPVRLVGHSMGGNIASLYAGIMPERVDAMINIEGFGLQDSDPSDAPVRFRSWLDSLRQPPEFSVYASYADLGAKLRKRNPGLDAAEALFVARQWAEDRDGKIQLRADPNHKMPNAILYRRAEAEACWRQVRARVLLVSGEKSAFAQPDDRSGQLPFADSKSASIDGVGHMIHFEAPEQLAALVDQFLS